MFPIMLASTSPYRAQALKRLGIKFSQISPNVDEDALKNSDLSPLAIAKELARQKTQAVSCQHPEAIVIGSDQLVSFQGHILGKPGSQEQAIEQLVAMSGKTHELITAVAIDSPDGPFHFENTTQLTMRQLDESAISRYVQRDNPIDCAGSYKIENGGISLFSHIDSTDHSAITGLPLIELVTCLTNLGHPLP